MRQGRSLPVSVHPAQNATMPQTTRPIRADVQNGRLTLDQINEGFDRLHEGQAIRQVVVFP